MGHGDVYCHVQLPWFLSPDKNHPHLGQCTWPASGPVAPRWWDVDPWAFQCEPRGVFIATYGGDRILDKSSNMVGGHISITSIHIPTSSESEVHDLWILWSHLGSPGTGAIRSSVELRAQPPSWRWNRGSCEIRDLKYLEISRNMMTYHGNLKDLEIWWHNIYGWFIHTKSVYTYVIL